MRCSRKKYRDEETQLRFFTGQMEEGERQETFLHLSQCPDCRESFESRRREFRDRIIRSAAQRGYLPPDRSGLRKRVFRAVARDRATREPASRRTILPLHPGVALVAVAALILVAVGIRYLGDTRWTGRRLTLGGAQLLLTSDGDRFHAVVEGEHDVSEGDLVLVLPGPEATFELPDKGVVHLPAPALIALDEREGHPRILLARGYLQVDSRGGPPVLVNAAGREFEVEGIAEFTVEETSHTDAFQWASQVLGRTVEASIFPPAWAAARPHGQVTAHVRQGRAESRSGDRIRSGQVSSYPPGAAGSAPVRIGAWTVLRPITEFLDPTEIRALRALLAETGGDRAAIARVLDRAVGPAPSKTCLAAWLLGELGHPDGVRSLRRVLDARPPRSPALRSAAASSLIRLADDLTTPSPWDLVSDTQPAVAEAALLGAERARLGNVVSRLTRVFDDESLPSYLRVLAAALLQTAEKPVPDLLLVGFLAEDDPSVAALAARTLGQEEEGRAHLARYLPRAGDDLAATILTSLSRAPKPHAEEEARKRLERTTGRTDPVSRRLFAAAMEYLGRIRAPDLGGTIRWALSEGDDEVKGAALRAISWNGAEAFRRELEAILTSSEESSDARLRALRLLKPGLDILQELAADPDPGVRAEVSARLLEKDASGNRGPLARTCLELENTRARASAWKWLGRHAPVEAIERAERGLPDDPDAVISGLREVHRSPSLPPKEADALRDRTAAVFAAAIRGTVYHPGTKDAAIEGIRQLALLGGDGARTIVRALVDAPDLPRDIRLRAATTLANTAEGRSDEDILVAILCGEDEGIAAAVARTFTTRNPRPAVPDIRRLRRAAPHPRARARLAMCAPFDPEYTAAVLDAGDRDAVTLVLSLLHPGETRLVRDSVQRHLESGSSACRIFALRQLSRANESFLDPDAGLEDPDPWVRILALAVGSTRGVAPPPGTLKTTVAAAMSEDHPRPLDAALRRFRAAPDAKSAGELLARANSFPPARAALREANQALPLPSPRWSAHDAVRQYRYGRIRTDAMARLESGDTPARLVSAVRDLALTGGRADVARLLREAGDETRTEEVRRAAIRGAAKLLGRPAPVAEPGPALSELRAWWSERSFALPVPVLPR